VRFGCPGHVYGPDGLRVSRSEGERSVGEVDPGAVRRWRKFYGSTLFESVDTVPLEVCS